MRNSALPFFSSSVSIGATYIGDPHIWLARTCVNARRISRRRRFDYESIKRVLSRAGSSVLFPGPFRLDDDDAIPAARAVDGSVLGILQHRDRFDVVGVDPDEGTARPRRDRYVIDHVQRFVARQL